MNTLIFLPTLLHTREICLSKFRSESIWISNKFFSWTWSVEQGSTKISFFRSFGAQKKVAFFRVGCYVSFVKLCKEFNSCYLSFRNNCINIGRPSLRSCIVSIVFNVRIFIFVGHFRNRPKIEPCGTPYSILNLLLKHPFVLVR